MSSMRAFRLVLAVVIAVLVLRAVPAYSSHEGVLISALAIYPLTPTTLYAGTYDAGYKSTDGVRVGTRPICLTLVLSAPWRSTP